MEYGVGVTVQAKGHEVSHVSCGGVRLVGLSLGAGFVAGFAVAAVFWRRQVRALVSRAKPYVRKQNRATRPALIINRWSGDGKADRCGLADEAQKAGIRPIMLERGDDLTRLAHDAVSAGADAIGMAGGDGSLGLVAGVAVERGVPFFCVPVGTRNHFALDLGLDRGNPLTALDALRDGEEILIDYGVANGRPFLNNVSFGVYAQAVHREEYRGEKTATLAAAISSAASDVNAQAALRYATPDGRTHERAPLLLVSNNLYKFSGHPDYGRRLRMDSGKLGVSALTNLPEGDVSSMRLDQLLGLYDWEATSVTIPAISWPGTSGYRTSPPHSSRTACKSEWQIPVKWMSKATSWSPASRRVIVVWVNGAFAEGAA